MLNEALLGGCKCHSRTISTTTLPCHESILMSSVSLCPYYVQVKPKLSRKSSGGGGARRSASAETDPERLFSKLQKIGKGNFGEVYKG